MTRSGIGYDSHRLEAGRKLMIGGVHVPFDKGPVGHSDGDVLAHALCDALLGAASLGDIGTHFPDTDPKWKNANSLMFLEHTRKICGSPISMPWLFVSGPSSGPISPLCAPRWRNRPVSPSIKLI